MKLSVIIPCFNEANSIDRIIGAVNDSPYQDKEIIVIDDRSTDGTREKLKNEIEPSGSVHKVIYHEVNRGKGADLRSVVSGRRPGTPG